MAKNLPKIYFWPFTLSVILAKKVEFIYLFILTFNLFSESLFFLLFSIILRILQWWTHPRCIDILRRGISKVTVHIVTANGDVHYSNIDVCKERLQVYGVMALQQIAENNSALEVALNRGSTLLLYLWFPKSVQKFKNF